MLEQSRSPESQKSRDLDYTLIVEGGSGGGDSRRQREMRKQAAEEDRRGEIGNKLWDVIINHRQSWQNIYGSTEDELNKSLEGPIKQGEEMTQMLTDGTGCSNEVAKDLAVLTLYDLAILIGMLL